MAAAKKKTKTLNAEYRFRPGARIPAGIDKDVAISYIRDFTSRNMSPEEVYQEITADPAHPLYSWYDWDSENALHEYHIIQTRQMLRSVQVIILPGEPTEVHISLATSVSEKGTGRRVYTDTISAMQDPVYREQLLQEALAELRRFQQKYKALTELAGLLGVISSTIQANDRLAVARAKKKNKEGPGKHFKSRGTAQPAVRTFFGENPGVSPEMTKAIVATFEKLYAQALERFWPDEDEAHAAVKELNDSLSDRQRRVLHMNIRKSYAQRTATPPAAAQVTVTAQSRREVQRYELVRMVAPMVVQASGRLNAATKERGASPQALAKFSLAIVDSIIEELYKKS